MAILPLVKHILQTRLRIPSGRVDLSITRVGFLCMAAGCLIMGVSQVWAAYISGIYSRCFFLSVSYQYITRADRLLPRSRHSYPRLGNGPGTQICPDGHDESRENSRPLHRDCAGREHGVRSRRLDTQSELRTRYRLGQSTLFGTSLPRCDLLPSPRRRRILTGQVLWSKSPWLRNNTMSMVSML